MTPFDGGENTNLAVNWARQSPVDLSAMTDSDHEDDQFSVINSAQNSVVTDYVAPIFTVLSPKSFSDTTGISFPSYLFIEEFHYSETRLRPQLAEVLDRTFSDPIVPARASLLHLSRFGPGSSQR